MTEHRERAKGFDRKSDAQRSLDSEVTATFATDVDRTQPASPSVRGPMSRPCNGCSVAKASMTLDTYADLFDEDLDEVADRLDAAIQATADGLESLTNSNRPDLLKCGGGNRKKLEPCASVKKMA